MATEVILKDEATRRAVEYALWYHASSRVEGDALDQELWDAGLELIGTREVGTTPSRELAGARLNSVVAARADI